MVNVVVTGGVGFLGARLARELLAADALDLAGASPRFAAAWSGSPAVSAQAAPSRYSSTRST